MNLNLLSMIGLLVGLYLIFQSLDGAVVRRREEISILRSLGVTESLIRQAWLLEAALLGLIGGRTGSVAGLGRRADCGATLSGGTVNALYYTTSVQSARLSGRASCSWHWGLHVGGEPGGRLVAGAAGGQNAAGPDSFPVGTEGPGQQTPLAFRRPLELAILVA
jgi:hypothetical protein